MSIVIATRGAPSQKIVDGELQMVVPFVGTDSKGEYAQMGIGVVFPDGEAEFWGLCIPHNLIQSWRGMKLLEQVERIEHGTLCACWTVVTRKFHDSDRRHLDNLANQFGGLDELEEARNAVLSSAPGADEIKSMITVLRENNVTFNSSELAEEIEAGRITSTPLIETLAREEKARWTTYTNDDKTKKPTPSLVWRLMNLMRSLFR